MGGGSKRHGARERQRSLVGTQHGSALLVYGDEGRNPQPRIRHARKRAAELCRFRGRADVARKQDKISNVVFFHKAQRLRIGHGGAGEARKEHLADHLAY